MNRYFNISNKLLLDNQGFVLLEPESTVDNQIFISFEDFRELDRESSLYKKSRKDRKPYSSLPVNYL